MSAGRQPVIVATDASPAEIAKAFARAAPKDWGPLGPINSLVVYIPGGPQAVGHPARPTMPAPRPRGVVENIRASRFSIAGYAVRFGLMTPKREYVKAGAFTRWLASREDVYLLFNHVQVRPSFASIAAGTLYLEEDRLGLWLEASLRNDDDGARVCALIDQHEITGVSPSWDRGESDGDDVRIFTGPVRVWTSLRPFELSLLARPNQPRFTGSWVSRTAEALRQRQKLVAA
jgi:HK97 family phage prohead protease